MTRRRDLDDSLISAVARDVKEADGDVDDFRDLLDVWARVAEDTNRRAAAMAARLPVHADRGDR